MKNDFKLSQLAKYETPKEESIISQEIFQLGRDAIKAPKLQAIQDN